MRISQCHISKSVADFPWLEIYTLDDYSVENQPAVFFGMYRYEDLRMALQHQSTVVIFWTGQDVLQDKWKQDKRAFSFLNVTAHPKVAQYIRAQGYKCELVAPSSFLNTYGSQVLGNRIYAYCPNTMRSYHGSAILDELKRAGLEIVVGDGSISQGDWRNRREEFYKDIFIGLCLSSFAGGGTSIIEMGLRGIRAVTNVFNLPNTLPWVDNGDVEQSAQFVAGLITAERERIGRADKNLGKIVYKSLDHEFKWLEI